MGCKNIPDLIEYDTYEGDYFQYQRDVYELYRETFENERFFFRGKRIAHKKHPLYEGKSCTFWHIISDGKSENTREPNLNRYARIAWPAYILGHCCNICDKILIWENTRRNRTRTLLWCKKINYLVVLDNREDYYIFWTAYPVIYAHTKRKLQKEYEAYLKTNP